MFLYLHPIHCQVRTTYDKLFHWREEVVGAVAARRCWKARAVSSALSAWREGIFNFQEVAPRPVIVAICARSGGPAWWEVRGSDRGSVDGCSKDSLIWKVPRTVSNKVEPVYKQPNYYSRSLLEKLAAYYCEKPSTVLIDQ